MAKRVYGDRAAYNKIRKAQSQVRKLARTGLVSQKTADNYIKNVKISSKTGQPVFASRALNNAMRDYFDYLEGYDRAFHLTREQEKQFRKSVEYLPKDQRPLIRNGVVTVAKGQYVSRSKEGVKIKHHFETPGFDHVFVGKGRSVRDIEADIREYAAKYGKNTPIGFELVVNGPGSARTYMSDVEQLIAYLLAYRASGLFDNEELAQIRLVRHSHIKQDQVAREQWHADRKANRKPRARKKAKPLNDRQRARRRAYMAEKRASDPQYAFAERVKNRDRMRKKREKPT